MNIDIIIKQGEGESIEFKESFSEKVIETLVAFANARGGKVLIGVKDNGKIIGTTVGKESIQQWVNEIKNKTIPGIVPEVIIEKINGKSIIILQTQQFPIKPVGFKGKYYKRVGNSNHELSIDEITNLYLQSLNYSVAGKIERYGTGLKKIRDLVKTYPKVKFKINSLQYHFVSHFYVGEDSSDVNNINLKSSEKSSEKGSEKSSEKSSEKILRLIKKDRNISAKMISKEIGISSRAIEKHIKKLKEKGIIKRVGPDKGGYWEVGQ